MIQGTAWELVPVDKMYDDLRKTYPPLGFNAMKMIVTPKGLIRGMQVIFNNCFSKVLTLKLSLWSKYDAAIILS